MLRPQQRAFPLKNSHDNMGMFNQNGIGSPHPQRERGNITDLPAGILHMHTFKKLPTQAPTMKTSNTFIASTM
jgi:hypothetical protein